MSEVKWYAFQWLKVRWLVYIVAFFLPVFGWIILGFLGEGA